MIGSNMFNKVEAKKIWTYKNTLWRKAMHVIVIDVETVKVDNAYGQEMKTIVRYKKLNSEGEIRRISSKHFLMDFQHVQ